MSSEMDFKKKECARLRYGSYISMKSSFMYMETPKAACSSFKHLLAALSNQNQETFHSSTMIAKTAVETIHDRGLFELPSFVDLSSEQREHVLVSEGFLRFCVVRSPFQRLASAWIDKFLCHSLSPNAEILQYIDFPEYIPDWNYLRLKFNEFINHLYHVEFPNLSNHHWQQYHQLLLPHIINYNLIIKVEELKFNLAHLVKHIEDQGQTWPGLPRINETSFDFSSNLYTVNSVKKVHEMFRNDFVDYGYETLKSLPTSNSIALPAAGLIKAIQQRNQRINYLSLKLRSK